MTRAPESLSRARKLLLTYLGPHGLEPAEVGIVGDANHRGGYHCGRDRLDPSRDYSVVESGRDRAGLSDDAAGLDVGMFSYGPHTLRTFSVWCVGECARNAPDTRDIREIIYSPDGKIVWRWDRLGKRTSGDSSHLTHTHFSVFRDSTGRDPLAPLFRRYLEHIGLIETEDEDMVTPDQIATGVYAAIVRAANVGKPGVKLTEAQAKEARQLRDAFQELVGREAVSPAELTAALEPVRADLERVKSGDMSADEFVDALARRLTQGGNA